MEYRNSSGGVHYGHSVVSNHESSHGVELTGGSTGGVIRTASDDASAGLSVRAKGPSGILALGTSTGGNVTLDGSSFAIAAPAAFTGVSFAVNGASSIVLAPTSTAGITIGNSSNPIFINGSTTRIASTFVWINSSKVFFNSEADPLVRITETGIVVGNSSVGTSVSIGSTHVNITSTRVQIGGASTTALSGIQRYAVDFTPPELAAAAAGWTTYTVTGLSTASAVFISPHLTFSSQYVWSSPRCSTANELSVLWTNQLASSIGTGESTNQWRVMEFRF